MGGARWWAVGLIRRLQMQSILTFSLFNVVTWTSASRVRQAKEPQKSKGELLLLATLQHRKIVNKD